MTIRSPNDMNLNKKEFTFSIKAISLEKTFKVLPIMKIFSSKSLFFSIQKIPLVSIPILILESSLSWNYSINPLSFVKIKSCNKFTSKTMPYSLFEFSNIYRLFGVNLYTKPMFLYIGILFNKLSEVYFFWIGK